MLATLMIFIYILNGDFAEAKPEIEGDCDPKIAEEALKIARAAFYSKHFYMSDSAKELATKHNNILFYNKHNARGFTKILDDKKVEYLSKLQGESKDREPQFLIAIKNIHPKWPSVTNIYSFKPGTTHTTDSYKTAERQKIAKMINPWVVRTYPPYPPGQIFFMEMQESHDIFTSLGDINVVPLLEPTQQCKIKFYFNDYYEKKKLANFYELIQTLGRILGECQYITGYTDEWIEHHIRILPGKAFITAQMAIHRPWSLTDPTQLIHSRQELDAFLKDYSNLTLEQVRTKVSEKELCEAIDQCSRGAYEHITEAYAIKAPLLYKHYQELYPLAEKELAAYYQRHHHQDLQKALQEAKQNLDFVVRIIFKIKSSMITKEFIC